MNRTKLPALILLSLFSAFVVLCGWCTVTTPDPEGKIVGAFITGTTLAIVTPFWGLFRGRAPLWCVFVFLAAVLLAAMQLNAWATWVAQDGLVHPAFYEWSYFALFSIPGVLILYGNTSRAKPRQVQADQGSDAWPPPPKPPA